MAASENEDNDILWCINHDSFPFQKPMMETQAIIFILLFYCAASNCEKTSLLSTCIP